MSESAARAFRVQVIDNVATLLDDVEVGVSVRIIGADTNVIAIDRATVGHKLALFDIDANAPVIKFGVEIGRASIPVRAGAWVHLHNLSSNFDARSQSLDLHTGAATDTRYE